MKHRHFLSIFLLNTKLLPNDTNKETTQEAYFASEDTGACRTRTQILRWRFSALASLLRGRQRRLTMGKLDFLTLERLFLTPLPQDVDGKEYIDFIVMFSAVNTGHCHPRIMAAVIEEMQKGHKNSSWSTGKKHSTDFSL